jgi:hypothetical protein
MGKHVFGIYLLNLNNDQRKIFIFLVLLTPLFILSAFMFATSVDHLNGDFFTFWLAGRMNWTNQNPYLSNLWISGHHQYGASWIANDIFPYPLPLAILLAPFGLFTLNQAYVIWVILSEIFIVVSVCLFLSAFIENPQKIHFIFPFIAAAFIFRPTIVTISNGQLGAFLLIFLSLTIIFWINQKYWQGAIILTFLIIKPTIGVPIIFLVLVWLFFKKNYKTIKIIIGSGFVWIIIGLLRDSQWITKFLSNGSKKFFDNMGLYPNIWGISSRFCRQESLCTFGIGSLLVIILLLITFYVLQSKKTISAFHAISIIIPVSLLITPYIWAYDQILLIVPLMFASIMLYHYGFPYILVALFPISFSILSLSFLFLAIHLNHDNWSFLIPLTLFILILVLPQALKNDKKCMSLAENDPR